MSLLSPAPAESPTDRHSSLHSRIDQMLQLSSADPAWKFHSRPSQVDIFTRSFQAPDGSPAICTMGIGQIPAAPWTILATVLDLTHRHEWDELFSSGREVEIENPWNFTVALQLKAISPTKPRDLVYKTRIRILENGEIYASSFSVPHADCPVKSSHVRSELLFAGYHLQTINSGENGGAGEEGNSSAISSSGSPLCRVTYICSWNPKGNFPQFAVNFLSSKQPLVIAAIRKYLADGKIAERSILMARERQAQMKAQESGETVKASNNAFVTPVKGRRETQQSGPVAATAPVGISSPLAAAGDEDIFAPANPAASVSNIAPVAAAASTAERPAAAVAAPKVGLVVKGVDGREFPMPAEVYQCPPCEYDVILRDTLVDCWRAVCEGEEAGWVFNSRQQEVDIYMKKVPGSSSDSCKGIGIVPFPPALVSNLFNDNEYRTHWDDMQGFNKEISIMDPFTGISHIGFKAPFPVTPRDLLAIGRTVPLVDGSYFTYSRSIESPLIGPLKGHVRCTLHFCGLLISPLDGGKSSKVIYAMCSDPNGSIPKWIVNAANTKQPLCIAVVKNVFLKGIKGVEADFVKLMKAKEIKQQKKIDEWLKEMEKQKNKQNVQEIPEETPAPTPTGNPGNASAFPPNNALVNPLFVSSEFDSVLATCYGEAMKAIHEGEEGGWVFNSRQQEVDIYMKKIPGTTTDCCKGIGVINFPPAIVNAIFADTVLRSQWDEIYDKGHTVKKIDFYTTIQYSGYKAPFPVTGRDFCLVGRKGVPLNDGKGSVFSYSRSVDFPACPVVKEYVRATLFFSGLLIEPIEGGKSSRVTYTLGSDPNGSIPKWLVNAANTKQPLCIATVRNVLNKKPALVKQLQARVDEQTAEHEKLMAAAGFGGENSATGGSTNDSSESSAAVSPRSSVPIPNVSPLTLDPIQVQAIRSSAQSESGAVLIPWRSQYGESDITNFQPRSHQKAYSAILPLLLYLKALGRALTGGQAGPFTEADYPPIEKGIFSVQLLALRHFSSTNHSAQANSKVSGGDSSAHPIGTALIRFVYGDERIEQIADLDSEGFLTSKVQAIFKLKYSNMPVHVFLYTQTHIEGLANTARGPISQVYSKTLTKGSLTLIGHLTLSVAQLTSGTSGDSHAKVQWILAEPHEQVSLNSHAGAPIIRSASIQSFYRESQIPGVRMSAQFNLANPHTQIFPNGKSSTNWQLKSLREESLWGGAISPHNGEENTVNSSSSSSPDIYSAPLLVNETFRLIHSAGPLLNSLEFLHSITNMTSFYKTLVFLGFIGFFLYSPNSFPFFLSFFCLSHLFSSLASQRLYSNSIGTEFWFHSRIEILQQKSALIQYLQTEENTFSPATKLTLGRIQGIFIRISNGFEGFSSILHWNHYETSLRFCVFCVGVLLLWPIGWLFMNSHGFLWFILLFLCFFYHSPVIQLILWGIARWGEFLTGNWTIWNGKARKTQRIPKLA